MNVKNGLITLAAIAAGGVAAATVAPLLASKAVDTADTKNWWAPAAVGIVLGSTVAYLGRKHPPVMVAGMGMASAGVGFGTLSLANKMLLDKSTQQVASGPFQSMVPVAPAAMPAYRNNSGRGSQLSSRGGYARWNGIPQYSQRFAEKGGVPTRSGSMPWG